jgi:hypothetical protein
MSRVPMKFCAEQIARLRQFPSFPKSPIGQKELVHTLARYAKSEDHCRRIVDRACIEGRLNDDGESTSFCPVAGDLFRLAGEVPIAQEVPPGCEYCVGTGWISRPRIYTDPISGKIISTDHAGRCDCPRGRHLREMDLQRGAK